MMKGKQEEAMVVLKRANDPAAAETEFKNISESLKSGTDKKKVPLG